ncbi:MAG TPA: BON domain-containing protein [Gemmatimonadaceae bacterium]|jgi:osmotically-inducible protein OsmY
MSVNNAAPVADDVERRIREVLDANVEPDLVQHVSVCVKGTCAVLKGAVRSWAEHEDAERAALSIPGVTSVDNQLALLVKGKLAAR